MTLELNHTQRINLHALLGAQRGDVATVRALWTIQDRLALTPAEESAIELKREFVAGQERALWNPALSIPMKHFEFNEAEISRLRLAIESCDNYGASGDRRWLEPILSVFSADRSIR